MNKSTLTHPFEIYQIVPTTTQRAWVAANRGFKVCNDRIYSTKHEKSVLSVSSGKGPWMLTSNIHTKPLTIMLSPSNIGLRNIVTDKHPRHTKQITGIQYNGKTYSNLYMLCLDQNCPDNIDDIVFNVLSSMKDTIPYRRLNLGIKRCWSSRVSEKTSALLVSNCSPGCDRLWVLCSCIYFKEYGIDKTNLVQVYCVNTGGPSRITIDAYLYICIYLCIYLYHSVIIRKLC